MNGMNVKVTEVFKHFTHDLKIIPLRSFKSKPVRVRFAPSPTGYLHLGGLRTALYNFLFANSRNGSLVLRIEDTDQTRKVEGSVNALVRDLEWAGILCNEGPILGGQYGPYIQSERLEIYKKHVEKLLANGSAYQCFCTDRRLNVLRRDAVRSHQIPKYDNKCRHLSAQDIKDKIDAGAQYCIRFKLSSSIQSFEDMIFGGIAYDVSINEGDPVIMKSDGFPTYHFANVVDDHLMKITHVLRGVEWQISTTKHLLMYRAFGWDPPRFGHLPLIVNADGTKLSKRQNDVKVEDYRNNGIFPLALVNYITLSGGGFDHVPGAGVRIKTLDELAKEINKISSHPSRLNRDLLNECNRLELKRQLTDENKSTDLVKHVQDLVTKTYPQQNLNIESSHVQSVLKWATARVSKIEDLTTSKYGFLWILPAQVRIEEQNVTLLTKLVSDLNSLDKFEQDNLKGFLKQFSSANGVKFPVLMKILRSVLSGLNEGPSVAEMMSLLGKEQSVERIRAAVR